MERAEAEAILDGDRETAVGLLLRLDALVETNQRLVEANERLEARVAELERRLSRSSRNSSLPPSQDPPWAPPRPGGRASGRKRGGQPGHEGRHRALLPPEQVDEVVEHWPERCLFGVAISTGSVDAIVHRAGEALAAPHTRLEQELKSAPVVNIDETGWKTAGGNRTLWGALSGRAAVFRIAAGRHGFEARTLLGERFAGIVCSDRWRGYDYLDPSRRQLCWAHLLRDFTAHSEGMGEQKKFGEDGLRIARELFACWDGYQADGDRARLQAQIAPLHDELHTLLEHAARKSTKTKYHRRFAKGLLTRWPALWTFTHTDGVEPTNNHAERGLRGAVIYRKLSLGSQSEHGERTIERLLSASVTCRLQKRSLFAYLSSVLTASIRGDPIPALA
jgi:transposase